MQIRILFLAFAILIARYHALRAPDGRNKMSLHVGKARVDADSALPSRQLPDASKLVTAASSLAIYVALPIMPVLAGEQNLALSVGRPVLDSFVNIIKEKSPKTLKLCRPCPV